jgi:predicted enzyme related to lactoylglutathione lyase/AraC-like DNA-binding protein
MMYRPIQDGIDRSVRSVRYSEAQPPMNLAGLVHCFWELKTIADLSDDFHYHALPDACANILLDQVETDIAGVTALRLKAEVLNLGKSFHYVGIQFYPGVWQGKQEQIFDRYVGTPYLGSLPLIQVSENIKDLDFNRKLPALSDLVEWLLQAELIKYNVLTAKIMERLDRIHTVADMARITELSPRQLQRQLKRTTGFSPHDFLKVLRVQQSFGRHYLELYADQSHYIHSFRKVTGYTPAKYTAKFDVRSIQYKPQRDRYTVGSTIYLENDMDKPNAIGWFDIYVEDLDRAVRFYEQVLDRKLEPIVDPTGETQMMSFPANMGVYGASGALVKSNHSRPGVGGTMIYFSVEDCSVPESRIIAANGQIVRSKFSIGEFGWVTLCVDTEGNMFGLNSMK